MCRLQLVTDHPVFVFMKGTPEAPQCGFSQQVVRVLHAHGERRGARGRDAARSPRRARAGVNFSSVNVLEHSEIREGVKAFSDWPTIPQLYVGGEFVGGCDVVTDLHNEGELEAVLAAAEQRA